MLNVTAETVNARASDNLPAVRFLHLVTLLTSALAWTACSADAPAEHLVASEWGFEVRDSYAKEWRSEASLAERGLAVVVNDDDDNQDGFVDNETPLPVEGENDLGAVRLLGVPDNAWVSFEVHGDGAQLFFRSNRTLPVEPGQWLRRDAVALGADATVFIEGLRGGTAELVVRVRDAGGRVTSRRIAI
jgi:hypothetical protein